MENAATGMEVTIHWHGIFQNGFQYYDSVPYVTQFPIASSSTFRVYHPSFLCILLYYSIIFYSRNVVLAKQYTRKTYRTITPNLAHVLTLSMQH
ncbi:uncharacterized protein LOC122578009 isoform X2 [Bombus pyrosoma]|uniref:uncharacterized protein LOC122578009 isoform X2 n=1 Tax=Bombus pyrosoma TaxID=396416 RepID=UPI001CB929ED|nr:uncharacterized protein LOC122578009 isoform X2 [Bombus pyrosoma]